MVPNPRRPVAGSLRRRRTKPDCNRTAGAEQPAGSGEEERQREERRERKVGKRERGRESGGGVEGREEEEEEGRLHSAPRSHAQIIGNAAKNKRWRKENISRLRSGSSQLCPSPTLLPFPFECSDTAAGKSRGSPLDGMMKLLPGRKKKNI